MKPESGDSNKSAQNKMEERQRLKKAKQVIQAGLAVAFPAVCTEQRAIWGVQGVGVWLTLPAVQDRAAPLQRPLIS